MATAKLLNAIAAAECTSSRALNAISLNVLLDVKYESDALELAKETGIPTSQIKRWIKNDAILCDGKVFLKATKFKETEKEIEKRLKSLSTGVKAIPFDKHLKDEYAGNQSLFAKKNNTFQQQVSRWENGECVFILGHVYRMQRELRKAV